MHHLAPFESRPVTVVPAAQSRGWHLKRYAITAAGRTIDPAAIDCATELAITQLPRADALDDPSGNHGVGFQIVHFAAEVSAVSTVYYWQWGSVLARLAQSRASWDAPHVFQEGYSEVVGCVWEMQVVIAETELWQRIMLSETQAPAHRLGLYMDTNPL
ncbi:MAG: hypothetical protein AAF393_09050 [Pseudomonadota bacterium]